MSLNRKRLIIAAAFAVCVLGIAGISKPGKATITKVFALFEPPPDVEQRARARHGWDRQPVRNSIVRGTIAFYSRDGTEQRRAGMVLYREYPDRLRLEIERDGISVTSGFNRSAAWRAGTTSVSQTEAREIRAWMRAWPDRLFVSRGAGDRYREGSRHVEDHRPPVPGRRPREYDQTLGLDQVEVEDRIGPQEPNPDGSPDRRRIYYGVTSDNSIVYTARWLEPLDPRQDIDDRNAPKMDMRVDFMGWRDVGGVLWPFEVIHWRGGKVDYRIVVSEVYLNQQLPDSLFQDPNR